MKAGTWVPAFFLKKTCSNPALFLPIIIVDGSKILLVLSDMFQHAFLY